MGVLGLDVALRQQLETILIQAHSARQLKRAQALLWVDDGEPISQVAKRLRTTRQTIHTDRCIFSLTFGRAIIWA